MFNLADVLQFIVNSLYDRPFPEEYFVMEIHQRVLHVPFQLCHQVYIIDEEHFEEVLADIPPVGEEFPEESLSELLVLQRFPVVDVSRGELPLDDFPLVVDDQMQLESVEPSHRALPLGRPSLHGLMLLLPLDVAGDNRRGVDDGYACALAEGAGLKEKQQVKPHLSLTLHEARVGYGIGEILAHVLADIAQIE